MEPEYNILNHTKDAANLQETVPPLDISLKLQRSMLQLKGHHMTEDGRGIDYERLRESELFREYIDLSTRLVTCDPSSLDHTHKMAFFINIYNSLTIHGLAASEELPSSVLGVEQFWQKTAYDIGGLVYSLDDIEHGVLRGNKPHPSASKRPFSEDDPRAKISLKSCDPRIHFALVCGAKSCPAIQVYSGTNLELALNSAATNFCSQEVEVTAGGVVISKIFHWYASDFGATEKELLQWVCQYLPVSKQEQLEKLLASGHSVEVKSRDYDWKLNKL
ncbi:uncharacterized protein LOC135333215 [Halichondria panicea]|uniref:uncharacterized protein LOC135333215 n=1 Tax=Halichondria panicea TaxID=6063 RepID=UPI00312B84BF